MNQISRSKIAISFDNDIFRDVFSQIEFHSNPISNYVWEILKDKEIRELCNSINFNL